MTERPKIEQDSEHASSAPRPAVGRAARLWSSMRVPVVKVGVGLMASALPLGFVLDELASSSVARNVHVLGVDLSKDSPERARARIADAARVRSARSVEIDANGKRAALSFQEAGVAIDTATTLQRALRSGREQGIFARFVAWANSWFSVTSVPAVTRVDSARLDAALDALEARIWETPSAGGVRLKGERFVPVAPRGGQRLDRGHARSVLASALEAGDGLVSVRVVQVPAPASLQEVQALARRANELARSSVVLVDSESPRVLELSPMEIRQVLRSAESERVPELVVEHAALEGVLKDRRSAIESEPVSARFEIDERDQVHIVPSEPAVRLDLHLLADALLAAASSPGKRGVLPLVRALEPALTTDGARALGIRGLVSSFTTRHACCEKRVQNIHRIADLLDGLLVRPGETVSVNTVVGPRTEKNGFVPAPSIEEGEMVDTPGGGISQFATTLFNALFHGGFDIVERQAHSYWFSRYPMGHEATLSYPKPDLIFRNDTAAGMLIDTRYTSTSITVRLFGDNGGRSVAAEVSPRQNLVEPPAEILGNPEVAPDEEKIKDAGTPGWTVTVGRIITFADGKKKEERRKVTYRPKPRKVEVHPCRIPKGEKGYTGERCPEPEDAAIAIVEE